MGGAKVQLCIRNFVTGALTCLMPKATDREGYFSVPVSESARCLSSAALRAIVPRVAFAPIYCHGDLTGETGDGILRIEDPIVLYQTRPALSIDEPSIEEGLHTVSLLGDVKLDLLAEDLYGPTVDELGGRPIAPTDPGLCFLEEGDDAPTIDGIYAFAPEGDITGSTARLSFANIAGYEPGEEVQIYVLGNLDCSIEGQEEPLEEGEWTIATTAVVDDGGMLIQSPEGEGLPCLSWFGYGPAEQ